MASAADQQISIPPLNDDHRREIGIALGLTAAVNVLREGQADHQRLPGFNTALALIEAIEATHRAHVAGLNFRAAAKAGVNITDHMIGMVGRGKIYADPMDLTQRAEFGAEQVSAA